MSFYFSLVGEGLPRLLLVAVGLVICAMSLRALSRIRSRLSGFARICHNLAGFGVIGLTVIWSVALLSGRLPPFWPVLAEHHDSGGTSHHGRDGGAAAR